MRQVLLRLFQTLEQANIYYCLMRDGDGLDQLPNRGEVDLLVQPSQFRPLRDLLAQLGFLNLPSGGHAPHHFFIAYDEESDGWLKLDVVTEVAYGKPIPALRTPLADACLARRCRCGPTFTPSPEDELATLLLHCVLDKGYFAPARRQRLQALRGQVADEPYLSALLTAYWSPTMTWPQMATLIEMDNWTALLAERATVTARLASRDRLGVLGRQVCNRVLRTLNRWAGLLRPAPSVALLAPDGAGKSTLAAGVQSSFFFPVRSVYMGLYQKTTAPAARPRVRGMGFVGHLFTQWRRYLVARYHQARGRLVIFDRYTFDALLTPRHNLGGLGRLRRWLLAHACPPPDLVLMLDAPGEVLYARKGEHTADILEQQRQQYLALRPYLPQMVVVDASRDAERVRREATAVIWRTCTAHFI